MTLDPKTFRATIGQFATGVTVIVAEVEAQTHGMTANAVSSLSLDPMLVLFCVVKKARMAELIQKATGFSINILREDQQALYGFRAPDELGFFNLLLTVTGVGPKVALAIVGSRPTPDLQLAIMLQDQAVLVSIPGIGKKLADRVIFELKEKVAAAGVAAASGVGVSGIGAAESEVIAALQALGYSLAEAREASRVALADATIGGTLEDRVKAALRSLLRE